MSGPSSKRKDLRPEAESRLLLLVRLLARSCAREWLKAQSLRQGREPKAEEDE